MREDCVVCHNRTVNNLLEKFRPEKEIERTIKRKAAEYIKNNFDNPYLATLIHRMVKLELNNKDLYLHEKQYANNILIKQYDKWKQWVGDGSEAFKKAAVLAVSGNVLDYGAHSVPNNVEKELLRLQLQGLNIDDTALLESKIEKAKSILYLGDNAGEIVFDKLFIETMNHNNVTYVTRGSAVINDVTLAEAEQVKMNTCCKLISNGYDAPSTLLEHCSGEFIEAYHKADLVISKGQGNFEGLMNERCKPIFFLLMAKCAPMAELLGVKKGDMVVKQQINKIYDI